MRLKELRKKKKITQQDLAKKIGSSQTSINHWELGINEPSIDALIKLADIFDCTVDYLIGRKAANINTELEKELNEASEEQIKLIRELLRLTNNAKKGNQK